MNKSDSHIMNKIILKRENEYLESYATLKGVSVRDMSEFGAVCEEVGNLTVLPDDFANLFLMFIEQYQTDCAMLSMLHVEEDCRGQGIGKSLVKDFLKMTQENTFKFVVARKTMKQRENFNLEHFYSMQGFETIYETEDEWVMVNKEKVEEVNDFLG